MFNQMLNDLELATLTVAFAAYAWASVATMAAF